MKLKLQNWIKFLTKLEGAIFNLANQKFNVYVYEIFIKKQTFLLFYIYI